jgi:NAD(P)H dehydrogenase (quinone)
VAKKFIKARVSRALTLNRAAELFQEIWSNHRMVELEGPQRLTPNEIAARFAKLLGRPVRTEEVPRETWESLFKTQGMRNPKMLDGFNEGWIEFEDGHAGSFKGNVALETVLQTLIPIC